MPLSDADKNTLVTKIITNYALSSIPGINASVLLAVELADAEFESRYPSAYVGTLTGTTLNEKKFILARELYAVYLLFLNYPSIWSSYSQAQSISSVKNSAGSSVTFQKSEKTGIYISDFAKQVQALLVELGLIKQTSEIVFTTTINRLA